MANAAIIVGIRFNELYLHYIYKVNYFSTLTNTYSWSLLTCIYSCNEERYVDIKSRPTLRSILAMCTIWTWSNVSVAYYYLLNFLRLNGIFVQ